MNSSTTALLLVGYQNDYFGQTGLLRQVVEASERVNSVVENTIQLIQSLPDSMLIVATPIRFSATYEELVEPIGILRRIKEIGAFQENTNGAKLISELVPLKRRILEVRGKRGFNAFAHTTLDAVLKEHSIRELVIAGAITSICIDSTGRSAHEKGYRVTILSDCTSARTTFEQEFYCDHIFPTYANVVTHKQLLNALKVTV
ncbi:MAG: cysteine hydrolase [Merismopedia sp. SIO2A8]|nr:cysteine hydrolase [Merismopedia sp. SIO2A8]